ncbi:lysine decarboxylase [bacterium BRH_c32]|nr:MAG: lysine decarboxylase [bacterium BRH_c32]
MKKDIKPKPTSKISKITKAYKNLEFLNSSNARTVRILAEYYEPKGRLEKNNIQDTIVFFGSARLKSRKESLEILREKQALFVKKKTKASVVKQAEKQLEMSRYYEEADELAKKLTIWSKNLPTDKRRFTICSGGGPGIMEAANKGAKKGGGPSIGFNISIPFEQYVNPYVDPENTYEFHYFFMRKFWFAYLAKALVVFPGGFGTLDELMEVLTLVQTRKIKKDMKIIIYDEIFWKEIVNFEALIDHGVISKGDMKLFTFCNNVEQAYNEITGYLTKNPLK